MENEGLALLADNFDKTALGRQYPLDNTSNLFISNQSKQILSYLEKQGIDYGYMQFGIGCVANAWRSLKKPYWVNGEKGTLDFVIKVLLKVDDHKDKETKERERVYLIMACSLFCYDRAIAHGLHSNLKLAAKWLESAESLFYLCIHKAQMSKEAVTEKAKNAAFIRHAETRAIRDEAFEYWCKNIDPKLSNDAAADTLKKVVPLSHRKLSQYVSEFKREKIPPARIM